MRPDLSSASMRDEREFLDFVLPGAPRCGTSWLFEVLNAHPDLWVPPLKELDFFNYRDAYIGNVRFEYPRGIEHYRKHFLSAPPNVLLGDISPYYYADLTAADRIWRHFPDVKIIFMLRNPAEVAFRNFLIIRQYHRRAKTFEAEIERTPAYLLVGFYHRLVTPYFDRFPRENIFVGIYEHHFRRGAQALEALYKSVLEFLGVDPTFRPKALEKPVNVTQEIRWRWLIALNSTAGSLINSPLLAPVKRLVDHDPIHRFRENIFFRWNLKPATPPPLSQETREWLLDVYKYDTDRCEELLGVNLDCWRE